jgi:eukaryotic-like serine/threonine-protein kinase
MTFAQIASAPLPDALLYRPDLPRAFQGWFEKAQARSIGDRFQTARELAESLAGVLASDSVHAPSMHSFLDITARAAFGPVTSPEPTAGLPSPAAGSFAVEGTPPSQRVDEGPSQRRQPSVVSPLSSTVDERRPERHARGHRGRALFTWLGVAVIVAGGYIGWLLLLRPAPTPITTMSVQSAPAAVGASASASPEPTAPAATKGPKWVALVSSAQAQIAASNLTDAVKTLHDASELAGGGPARVLYDQAQVSAAIKGSCKLTGLSRPRPFSLSNVAGRPTVAFTPKGALVAWTDNHESAANDHGYAVLLDAAMRSVGEPRDITPEAGLVTSPQLFALGDRFVVLYSDGKGAAAGIHVRWLDAEGRIDGPSRTVTTRRPSTSAPSLDRAPDGTFWVAWEDDRKVEASDLYLRHLSAELDPLGGEIRASDYVVRGKPHVRNPSIGIAGGYLTTAYRFEREPARVVTTLRIGLGDADLLRGIEPPTDKGPPRDRQIGEATILNVDKERADTPHMDCTTEGCFVVWHAEDGSACAAYLESTHGQVLWRKRFDRKGGHPTVAIAPSGVATVAWFGKGRLNLAPIARDGVGQPTALTRAMGEPPPAALTPGGAPGEWYVAWLETESGHPEVYAARAMCK